MAETPSIDAFLDSLEGDQDAAPEADVDDFADIDDEAEAEAEAEAPEAEPEAEAEEQAPAPEWWEKELNEARADAAKYRTRGKDFFEAFEGFDPDDQAFLLDTIRGIKADPNSTAEQLEAVVNYIRSGGEDGPIEDVLPDNVVTADRFEQLFEERMAAYEAKAAEEAQVARVAEEAKALGYEPGTEGYMRVLWHATYSTDGDLKAAHERLESERKAIIDEWRKAKKAEAESSTKTMPQAGSSPSPERSIASLDAKQRRAEVEQFLSEIER